VKAFAFDWTDFGHANGLGGIARAENLGVWQQTLPFVLEHVALAIAAAEDSETVWPVRVYVEQANEIKSGSPILAGMVRQLMEHHGHRPGWDRMQLDDPQVVGKSDHGWTAYADNLAHALVVPRKYAPELRARLDEHVVRIDIAKDSLAALRDVLALDGRDPTGMVESAAQRIDATTFHAARSLLVPAFQRAARALNGRPDGWSGSLVKSLGTLLAQRQETHAVIHALLREVDIDAILQHRDEPHGRDVFCAALNGALYAAVQQAERRRADELLGRWDDAVSEWSGAGWEPLQDTADHQAALRANAMMNRFAFVEALRVVDERLTARGGTGGRDPDLAALYGTRVQALAHLGRVDETNATLREYERHLDSARDRQRLACYRADACLVGLVATPAAASAGLAVIAKAAPLLRPGRGGPSPLAAAAAASPWLRRTALSCLWYCGSMRPKGWEALLDMPVVSGHPAEMIAFWEGALLSAKGRVKEAEERMRILVSLAHEAPGDSAGVRLLCYLNALAALGVRGCSAGDLGAIEGAICASSAPSTLEWLDDRRLLAACLSPFDRALAPLTFNNR
jgi:hypothetical protein